MTVARRTIAPPVKEERSRRRIRSKTLRNLRSLAHHRFGMFLRHKAHEAGLRRQGIFVPADACLIGGCELVFLPNCHRMIVPELEC